MNNKHYPRQPTLLIRNIRKSMNETSGKRPKGMMQDCGYAAAFVAQKSCRGAYGRVGKDKAVAHKEISIENYATVTSERLRREKEIRFETARRRREQKKRAKNRQIAEMEERDQMLEKRKAKKKNYVNYLRQHLTKVTVHETRKGKRGQADFLDEWNHEKVDNKKNAKNNHKWIQADDKSNRRRTTTDKGRGSATPKVPPKRSVVAPSFSRPCLQSCESSLNKVQIRDTKTMLRELRQQMKESETGQTEASQNGNPNNGNLGALDLNVGLIMNVNTKDLPKTNTDFQQGIDPPDVSAESRKNKWLKTDQVSNGKKEHASLHRRALGLESHVLLERSPASDLTPEIREQSPWKLTCKHPPSKLFDSLDLSMSLHQSIQIEVRRPESPLLEECGNASKGSIGTTVPNDDALSQLVSTIEKNMVEPSPNATTPSKPSLGNSVFESPGKARVGDGLMTIIGKDQVCTTPPQNWRGDRASPKYQVIHQEPSKQTPKSERGLIHPSLIKTNRSRFRATTARIAKQAAPWGRGGKVIESRKVKLAVAERRKVYMKTLRMRAKDEQLKRRNDLKDETTTAKSSRYRTPPLRYRNLHSEPGANTSILDSRGFLKDHKDLYYRHVDLVPSSKNTVIEESTGGNRVSGVNLYQGHSDESIEEEKIKASIERLENKLLSKHIVYARSTKLPLIRQETFLRGGSEVIGAHDRYQKEIKERRRERSIPAEFMRHDEYEWAYSKIRRPYTNRLIHDVSVTPGPQPPKSHCWQDEGAPEIVPARVTEEETSWVYPGSPGPPPPAPPPPQFLKTGFKTDKSRSIFSKKSFSQRLLSPGVENYQPCHIMSKNVSYMSLRQREVNARKRRLNQPQKSPTLIREELSRFDSRILNERSGVREKNCSEKNSGVLVNTNNLHLLLSPSGDCKRKVLEPKLTQN